MATMTIYLPENLRKRMTEWPDVNWSKLAQRTFEHEIALMDVGDVVSHAASGLLSWDAGRNVNNTMNRLDPVERLRLSRKRSELNTSEEAFALGQAWVYMVASYQDAKLMEAMLLEYDPAEITETIVDETFGGDFWELQASGRDLAWIRDHPEAMRHFWEGATAAWEPLRSSVEKD
ncbi:hypothetical protein AB1K42_14245 [Roseibium algicola]|uniref:hypothetical protein n=1 Tax=Roseibium algicola TaxID=2857014 RepID=UPI003457A002